MNDKPQNTTENLRGRASAGARWLASARFVRLAAQFFQLLILARLLEPGDFGLMAMVTVVTAFGEAFSDAGVGSAIIHFQEANRRQLSTLYWVNILSGIVVFSAVQLVAPFAATLFGEPEVIGLLRTASYMFLVMAVGQQFQFLMERDLRFRALAVIETVAILVGATIAILCARGGKGVHSLVFGILAFHATRSLLVVLDGVRRWRPSIVFAPRECKEMLRFGLFLVGERALNLGGQQLDKLILAILVDRVTLGYYSLAYNLIGRAYRMINPVFTRVAYPVLARVKDDLGRLQSGFLELMGVIAFLTMPLFAALYVLAEPVVAVQFGPGYEPCVPLLRILAFLGALFSLGNGLLWPSFMALLANAAGERFQGAVQGTSSSVGSLASIVGLITGGLLYEVVGRGTFVGSTVLIYLVAALCWLFAYSASRNARKT